MFTTLPSLVLFIHVFLIYLFILYGGIWRPGDNCRSQLFLSCRLRTKLRSSGLAASAFYTVSRLAGPLSYLKDSPSLLAMGRVILCSYQIL